MNTDNTPVPQLDFDFISILKIHRTTPGGFKPVAYHIPELDWFVYIENNCPYTTEYIPGSNVELLWSNDEQPRRLVGVKIKSFSRISEMNALEMTHPAK